MTDDTNERPAADDALTTDRTPADGRSPVRPPSTNGNRRTAGTRSTAHTRSTASTRRSAGAGPRSAARNGPIGGSEGDTSSAQARFWLTNDVLAFLLVVSFVGVVVGAATGALDLAAVPVEMRLAYLTVSGGAAVWTFGQPAYRTWARARRGGRRAAGVCCHCPGTVAGRSVGTCRSRTVAGRSAPTAARRSGRRPCRPAGRRRSYRTRR